MEAFYSAKEIAKKLRISTTTVNSWRKKGLVFVSGKTRESWVEEFINRNLVPQYNQLDRQELASDTPDEPIPMSDPRTSLLEI